MATFNLVTFNPPNTSYVVQTAHTINYFSKGIDSQGPYYRVEYLINNYSDSDRFINALRGQVTQVGGPAGFVTKTGAHQHPLSPNLFCVSAELVEGLGTPSVNLNGYPNYSGGALIRAEYRPWVGGDFTPQPQNNIDPGTPILWCTQELDFTVESYLIPKTQLTWYTSGKLLDAPFKKDISIVVMSLTFQRLPYLPMSRIAPLVGKINDSTFLGQAKGQVLFVGAQTTREMDTSGVIVQKVQLVFKSREADWNKLIDPTKTGSDNQSMGFDFVAYNAGGGTYLYPYTYSDFTPLLEF